MVYYTGDIHGDPTELIRMIHRIEMTDDDIVVILGDAGFNYYMDRRDIISKSDMSHLAPTILCIHGNHEARPHTVGTYTTKGFCGGTVWYEDAFPNLLFAKDGEIYTLEKLRHLVIGGAYSVDKFYRQTKGLGWWADEQPNEETKKAVEAKIVTEAIDVVLSRTCPLKYEPTEMFLAQINQSTVDSSTERWLDTIEDKLDYKAWFCGHWHVDKRIDRMRFLFHGMESQEQLLCNNHK